MANREKYAQEIIDILVKGLVAVDVSTGEPRICGEISCKECAFYEDGMHLRLKCDQKFEKWLNSECKDDKAEEKAIISHIVDYLNVKTGRHYRATNKATVRCIKARLKEGYDLSDFYKVVDVKTAEWMGSEYEKYLAPETLFGNKFDKYLNQPVKNQSDNKRSSKWGD